MEYIEHTEQWYRMILNSLADIIHSLFLHLKGTILMRWKWLCHRVSLRNKKEILVISNISFIFTFGHGYRFRDDAFSVVVGLKFHVYEAIISVNSMGMSSLVPARYFLPVLKPFYLPCGHVDSFKCLTHYLKDMQLGTSE